MHCAQGKRRIFHAFPPWAARWCGKHLLDLRSASQTQPQMPLLKMPQTSDPENAGAAGKIAVRRAEKRSAAMGDSVGVQFGVQFSFFLSFLFFFFASWLRASRREHATNDNATATATAATPTAAPAAAAATSATCNWQPVPIRVSTLLSIFMCACTPWGMQWTTDIYIYIHIYPQQIGAIVWGAFFSLIFSKGGVEERPYSHVVNFHCWQIEKASASISHIDFAIA